MPHHPTSETAVSAPGKVLWTGGYLVLDRHYTGTVFALNARIHVIVRQLRRGRKSATTTTEGGMDGNNTAGRNGDDEGDGDLEGDEVIVVRSPQFVDAVWEYGVRREREGGGVRVVQCGDGPRNPFVETSLNYALTYISYVAASKLFGSLSITILADNAYYSETAASQAPGATRGTRFAELGLKLSDAHKTGLGSSAALVTALVSAIVIHRTVQPEELPNVRDKLHNLAQAAHCAAQGKVGSGFDVAAAVYGSLLYRRFSAGVLANLGDVGSPQFEERLFSVVEDLNTPVPWDTECVDFGTKLPRGMQMVLADVDCGSETPGMVKKVLQWREKNREQADELWAELQENNEKLRLLLKELAHQGRGGSAAAAGSNNAATATASPPSFVEVSTAISRTRSLLRTMSKETGVPIEPRVQTELLDRLSELDGVIGGVVPGAGGYDAVALLVRDEAGVVENVRRFLSNWRSSVEDDFGGKIERVRLLGVAHGSEGLRNEMGEQYAGWLM
ncbi:phosphomevalonate kinase [Onygenales sp. PD_40]|nr:phosphomevalonate kinase [Onygenales sp. PD_40]